jgi:nucleotide-binding universal stress UspA family protein
LRRERPERILGTVIHVKQILVPVDLSEVSRTALDHGKAFASLLGASLHVLHVVEERFVHGWTSELYVSTTPKLRAELEAEARAGLEKLLPEGDRQALRARLVTRVGSPFLEIVRYAEENAIDLVVMGTHGHGKIARLLLGSVAERVVCTAPCPVLTVRHPKQEFAQPEG